MKIFFHGYWKTLTLQNFPIIPKLLRYLFLLLLIFLLSSIPTKAGSDEKTEVCSCEQCEDLLAMAGRTNEVYAPSFPDNATIVSTTEQLINALKNAENGQTIILENGTYNIGWQEVPAQVHFDVPLEK